MTDDDDAFDLDLHDDDRPADAAATECLGRYPSLAAFARAVLEPLVHDEGLWLLDCLDLDRVLRAMEGEGRYRLRLHAGRVLRDTLTVLHRRGP
jgi:hypothetical protein